MGRKTYCDVCKEEIVNYKNKINFTYTKSNKLFSCFNYVHKQCFNKVFKTDFDKVILNESF